MELPFPYLGAALGPSTHLQLVSVAQQQPRSTAHQSSSTGSFPYLCTAHIQGRHVGSRLDLTAGTASLPPINHAPVP